MKENFLIEDVENFMDAKSDRISSRSDETHDLKRKSTIGNMLNT
jgi:hypothetical protein